MALDDDGVRNNQRAMQEMLAAVASGRGQTGVLVREPNPSPAELATFMDTCKALNLRTAKGEFVASDGTRLPYDWTFEREAVKAKKGSDNG